ncbi:unnamed protein product [Cylicocyclus nassatus]|uniref:Ground-like domain-containing protein n=1 Tax=Cylicocyclus nassatus TaxID=53992 RepID=A0AA36DSK4_CYLNA|nr:unnamed protein product [Cylicocyclus nassatus]
MRLFSFSPLFVPILATFFHQFYAQQAPTHSVPAPAYFANHGTQQRQQLVAVPITAVAVPLNVYNARSQQPIYRQPAQIYPKPALQQRYVSTLPPPPSYPPAPPPYSQPPAYQQPTYATTQAYVQTTPAPRCWRNAEGFPCCSRDLESFMMRTLHDENNLKRWRGCNLQKAANELQKMAQSKFKYSFESIVTQSDMASKSRFMNNLMCKMRTRDGKIAMLYATPIQYSLESSDSHPLSEQEMRRKWTSQQMEITSTDDI